jgi:hypothetical protein
MILIAVLDANILFPMILRDTLLRVAAAVASAHTGQTAF